MLEVDAAAVAAIVEVGFICTFNLLMNGEVLGCGCLNLAAFAKVAFGKVKTVFEIEFNGLFAFGLSLGFTVVVKLPFCGSLELFDSLRPAFAPPVAY
jgi:hypothetical protein